jgi:hypothetical protein
MVSINGTMLKNKSPLSVKLKPGRYELLLSKDGYLVKDTTYIVNGDKNNQSLKASLTPAGLGSF